ncbi:MAG TPA: protoporphyrinogen oxidase [Acidobacteriaceae bacterium]|nr:protoporphyrinogen oxidase [Acidobacteriaceae bacterium]
MKRIAVIGGGIAGVSAAYELALQQRAGAPIEFTLFEATDRLGGTVETERRDGFVLECGPDSWVTEKPWARELAAELGLEDQIVTSQDEHRRTYLAEGRTLQPMPDGMRMMVPVQWAGVLNSPLFSWQAKLAYLREPKLAEELKASAVARDGSPRDESVRDFVFRHFGAEVTDTIAAPLLAGVFGGDIATLSARAVLPPYVALERQHGSLILGLQRRMQDEAEQGKMPAPVFSTLRNGLGSLIEGMEARIPDSSLRKRAAVKFVARVGDRWQLLAEPSPAAKQQTESFDALLLATPARATALLLAPLHPGMAELLPQHSSSAIVAAFAFSPEQSAEMRVPRGFGFLVPQRTTSSQPVMTSSLDAAAQRALLACTFVDQKFPHRAPPGAALLRVFFGGSAAPGLFQEDDGTLLSLAHSALGKMMGKLPEPKLSLVRRWPDSLPQYEVGHLDRIAELEARAATLPGLRLIGNAYHGVGLPDLIRAGRSAARATIQS